MQRAPRKFDGKTPGKPQSPTAAHHSRPLVDAGRRTIAAAPTRPTASPEAPRTPRTPRDLRPGSRPHFYAEEFLSAARSSSWHLPRTMPLLVWIPKTDLRPTPIIEPLAHAKWKSWLPSAPSLTFFSVSVSLPIEMTVSWPT